jgi:hypothetical protein
MKSLKGILVLLSGLLFPLYGQSSAEFEVSSPDGAITLLVRAGEKLEWSVKQGGTVVIARSAISLQLAGGKVLGDKAKVTSHQVEEIETEFRTINYHRATITDHYNQLSLKCKGDFKVIFRDGINADRQGSDYKREVMELDREGSLELHLAPGGGWAARFEKL